MPNKFIEEDFVALRRTATSTGKPFLTLAFGDEVKVIPDSPTHRMNTLVLRK